MIVGIVATAYGETASLAGRRPNIVLILADDLGFSDLGCYGAEVIQTPNIDRLGFGGMRFTQFYNNAKCAPTRASLLTGLYSQQVGCSGPPAVLTGCVTAGEALRLADYRTYFSGKWHAAETPFRRGFDHAYGLCDGHSNYWNPGPARPGDETEPAYFAASDPQKRFPRWAIDDREFDGWTPDDPNFYLTDAFTDQAIRYVEDSASDPRPFFLHLAYTAPHFPLQAPSEDIDRYRGKFSMGWDVLRQRRLARLRELGLLDPKWNLPPRDESVAPWSEIADPVEQDLLMAVYAAMVDRMDRNIGRFIEALERTGQRENTLIIFLSDNGGSDEYNEVTPDVPPGAANSFRYVGGGWANVSNTPFRKFKSWDHEGGISTPFIVNWPGVIPAGTINRDVAHVIDVLPTIMELSGEDYPSAYEGRSVQPCAGLSLLSLLEGRSRPPHGQLFWQFWRWSAVREGNWKAVRREPDGPWELYDLEVDRTETRDLAVEMPERVDALAASFREWERRVDRKPTGQ